MSKELRSESIIIFGVKQEQALRLRYISEGISAGFPSPALDFQHESIDLNQHLVRHPEATFYGRVKGQSLKDLGIVDGDLLVIDRSLEVRDGRLAVCFINGEFTAKRIKIHEHRIYLMPANADYQPILVKEEDELIIWGVVTFVIKAFT